MNLIIIFLSLSWFCLGHSWHMLPRFAPRCPVVLKASKRILPEFFFLPPQFKTYSEEELNQMAKKDIDDVLPIIRFIESSMLKVAFNIKETSKEAEPDTAIDQLQQVEQFHDTAHQIGKLNESSITDEPNTGELASGVEEEVEEPPIQRVVMKPDLYRLAVEMQKLAIQIAFWKSTVWFNDEIMKSVKRYCSQNEALQNITAAFKWAREEWGSPEDPILDKPLSLTDFRDKVTVLLEQWPKVLEATQPLRRFPPSDSNAYGDVYDEIFPGRIIDDAREYIKQHPLDEEYAGIGDVLDNCERVIQLHDEMTELYSAFTNIDVVVEDEDVEDVEEEEVDENEKAARE